VSHGLALDKTQREGEETCAIPEGLPIGRAADECRPRRFGNAIRDAELALRDQFVDQGLWRASRMGNRPE